MVTNSEKEAICNGNYIHDMNIARHQDSGAKMLLEAVAGFVLCIGWFLLLISI